jgi:type I restriction enzyme R subunit
VFCVSQNHAAKITQILNELAYERFPGQYQSDFAMQVTSDVPGAQQFSINFANNNLSGAANFNPAYRTSKTRVCVTVGMMTTGYDCQDILNLCLIRPTFSPTDFIQIKGRGTRKYNFTQDMTDPVLKAQIGDLQKEKYKMFDFFANCEYFEEGYNYDEILGLPRVASSGGKGESFEPLPTIAGYENINPDWLARLGVKEVGPEGMRIDRMFFEKFEQAVKGDPVVNEKIRSGDWDALTRHIEEQHFDKPQEYFNLEKLRRSVQVDRRLSLREMVEYIFGLIPYFKSKDELLDEEFDKFDSRYMPGEDVFTYARNFFKAYITDAEFRRIIDAGNFALLNVNPNGESFKKITPELRRLIPEYVKDYVTLNQFAA